MLSLAVGRRLGTGSGCQFRHLEESQGAIPATGGYQALAPLLCGDLGHTPDLQGTALLVTCEAAK